MNTEIILKVDTLKNLVEWIGRNFVVGERPTNARALYMFANKPGTPMEDDGYVDYSKFDSEFEAEQYFNAFENMKFIIESEIADSVEWIYNKGTQNERKSIKETWKITATPSVNKADYIFMAYCPKPYNPE